MRSWWLISMVGIVAPAACSSTPVTTPVPSDAGPPAPIDASPFDEGPPDPPFDAGFCTNGRLPQNQKGLQMLPGWICNDCHGLVQGAALVIAGTVFPTEHEADSCRGIADVGYTVQVVDANGVTVSIKVNDGGNKNGNFVYESPLLAPFHVSVRSPSGAVSTMTSEVPQGDCNACHTANGANGASGRIKAP